MGLRLELQALLKTITPHVYFQPPPNKDLEYPCIIYHRDRAITRFADGLPYIRVKGYQVIVIDANPDSEIPDKIGALPRCLFDRFYVVNNMNHDVYNLFF